MKNLTLALPIAILASVTPVYAEPNPTTPELLFVQSAEGVVFEDGTLTLKGVSPAVVFFSDRPQRIAGHVALSGFLKAWDESDDSFADDPPNASLSIVGDGQVSNVVVEISNPQLQGDELTYDVEIIEGEPPATGGTSSLFIDGLFSGSALQSTGRGAAVGALFGVATGNVGKGAAIGAGVGLVGNMLKGN
jgi:hypothetical protein